MHLKIDRFLPHIVAACVLLGVFGSALWSAERVTWPGPVFQQLDQLTRLETIRVLPHTESALSALEARRALEDGLPWRAWRLLRSDALAADALPAHALLAARAAADWGGWHEVRDVLEGREWLAHAERAEGLLLLGRAQQETGNPRDAASAYRRYLAAPNPARKGEAAMRLGVVLLEVDDYLGAAKALETAAAEMPEIADWALALRAEALADAGLPAVTPVTRPLHGESTPARLRRVMAEARSLTEAGHPAQALARLEREQQIARSRATAAEAARLELERGRILLEVGRSAEAREIFRKVAWDGAALDDAREAAARQLEAFEPLALSDHLARAAAYDAAGKPGLAARAYRSAIAAGAPDAGGVQLKLGRLLYRERDFGPARVAFQRAADLLSNDALQAEAELYAARSIYRMGSRHASKAIAELKDVVSRYPGTTAAGTASFLLGDISSTLELAVGHYRRAADTPSPDAREALHRLGDRQLKLKNTAAAIATWEEYVSRYPRGEETATVAYRVGRLHEQAGREQKARAMYEAAIAAEPLSYYALRAGDRLGVDPLDRVLSERRPWIGLASDAADAASVLTRLDALEQAGLEDEWEAELRAALRALNDRPAALISLAEGLRDRYHTVEAIRLGRDLLRTRNGEWDERLLYVIFPYPYRNLLEREADRVGLDPYLLAGLVRQESTFRPKVRSWVGATGLGQIMPATGKWLAGSLRIPDYSERLLEVPEVNIRMAANYLEDLVDRYDGARDLALAGYNAGPGRADRWKRQFSPGRDRDAFREAIPFDETRHYVKVVLRNAAVYERLYGDRPGGGSGLVKGE